MDPKRSRQATLPVIFTREPVFRTYQGVDLILLAKAMPVRRSSRHLVFSPHLLLQAPQQGGCRRFIGIWHRAGAVTPIPQRSQLAHEKENKRRSDLERTNENKTERAQKKRGREEKRSKRTEEHRTKRRGEQKKKRTKEDRDGEARRG